MEDWQQQKLHCYWSDVITDFSQLAIINSLMLKNLQDMNGLSVLIHITVF